jgi:hypothetical protein
MYNEVINDNERRQMTKYKNKNDLFTCLKIYIPEQIQNILYNLTNNEDRPGRWVKLETLIPHLPIIILN